MLLLNWLTILILLLHVEETNINIPITDFIMTYESTIFQHVLLIFGIVYPTMLSMLILLTFLKHAQTGSPLTKMLSTISVSLTLTLMIMSLVGDAFNAHIHSIQCLSDLLLNIVTDVKLTSCGKLFQILTRMCYHLRPLKLIELSHCGWVESQHHTSRM